MKILYIIFGSICLVLAVLGVFLPLLPTTPFLLLAAAAFARGSDKLYNWLLNHRIFGEYIRSFREDKAIPLRVKIISITLMIGVMTTTILTVAAGKVWLQILLAVIAIAVSIHILSFKTKKQ